MSKNSTKEHIGKAVADVTPAMVDAGLAVLYASGAIEHPLQADRTLVREIYLAMKDRRP
jgi:hypothetical protein